MTTSKQLLFAGGVLSGMTSLPAQAIAQAVEERGAPRTYGMEVRYRFGE
jgi:hypothetical protein